MAFIILKKWKYFELVQNKRINGKHKRELLFYMWTKLIIPSSIITKFKITVDNIARLKLKYQYLKIVEKS
jgi:hypothetical protein